MVRTNAMLSFKPNDKKKLEKFWETGRGCATPRPNRYQIARADERIRSMRVRTAEIGRIRVNVQFIHITDGAKGKITEKQRMDQVALLNAAFKKGNIQFHYDPKTVKVFNERTWYVMDMGSAEEREAKTYLGTTPERNLNFYTAGLGKGLLGWATFPYDVAGDRVRDGVVILDSSLPGGSAAPYNKGITAVHEVGHWTGLYHTFQGGCDAYGDHVGDTPAHAEPNFGTPDPAVANGACKVGQKAPVRNYMNYCDDAWLDHFTAEQFDRMKKHFQTYRPGFIE